MTFLFTDVEGSTRRWEADPDEMRLALAAHDEVLRAVIDAQGGWLFKHTGDGVCAAFSSPRAAVDAAVAAQRALELPVRMGIATGEAELRGADYFGAVLNRAARVMAAGDGGQILLDGATAGLMGEDDLIALGPKRLRDIAKQSRSIRFTSATVRILATSREGLRVTDEQLWPVPSLEVNSSAAMLFVERAQALASGISLAENKDAVAEICQRLDGVGRDHHGASASAKTPRWRNRRSSGEIGN